MAGTTPTCIKAASPTAGWSNRVLLLALLGIFFLTLFPFRFSVVTPLPPGRPPFLLAGRGKVTGPLDDFLNILLFVPFGFGLSEKLREKGWGWKKVFFTTWVSGALLSYAIEFLQLYIPSRDSGWQDILTNSTGAAVGSIMFILLGLWLVDRVENVEFSLGGSLTTGRLALVLLVYFGLWFGLSMTLQKDTRLSNFNPQSQLFVGGVSPPRFSSGWIQTWYSSPWKGTVSRLQLWNQAVPTATARALTAGEVPDGARNGLLASYDFSSSNPLDDQMGFLPPLIWLPRRPSPPPPPLQTAVIDSRSWLASSSPVTNLVEAFQKTNQFSIRVVCTPAETFAVDERIVSIVEPSGLVDLHLGQDSTHLILWFRNALSAGRAALSWNVPNAFVAGQPRDILFSYDGSNFSLYVDGSKNPHSYALGPGARAAALTRRIRTAELEGYNDVYDALIFFPAGALIGLAAFRKSTRSAGVYLFLIVAFLLPPFLYDQILSHVSGRPDSLGSVILCLVLLIAGSLWINADRLPA